MAHTLEAIATPQAADAGMGGETCGLVDHHEAEGADHRGWSRVP